MTNQLPKIVKEKQMLKEFIQKASYIVRKNMTEKEIGIAEDGILSDGGGNEFLPPPTIKKRST